jgi:phosphoribosylanthranilate isomerase
VNARVKVCGITRLDDGLLAAELGASVLGFVFWPKSPRFIDPSAARAIVEALPPHVGIFGVFVDQPVDYVVSVAGLLALSAIQLHGTEAVEPFSGPGRRLVKAMAVRNGFDPAQADALPPGVTVLLDAHDPVRRGGTGQTIDWTMAAAVAARRRTILSGGLNAENVRAAVEQVRPYMIDVSSGVESAPGVKDSGKLRALFAAVEGTTA